VLARLTSTRRWPLSLFKIVLNNIFGFISHFFFFQIKDREHLREEGLERTTKKM